MDLPSELVLLSDFNREFGTAYGLAHTSRTGLRGVLRRAVLVVDPDFTIVYRWDAPEPPRLPTPEEVLEALRNLAALPSPPNG